MALVLSSIKNDIETDLMQVVNDLSDIKGKLSVLKQQEKFLTGILQRAMGDTEEMTDGEGNNLCTWKFSERTGFDSKRFAEEHPEMAGEYLTKTTVRTFRI